MEELIGKKLGQYQIEEKIGEGGMASVFKAYQPSLDRYVALKVLPPKFAQNPVFVKRFSREARSIARLHHPNILPVYDFGIDRDYSYLVMRCVESTQTLGSLMHPSLDFEQSLSLVTQIAEALSYAHQHGVVHRDVKPSNILIDNGGWALLSDFGLAKVEESVTSHLTDTGKSIGTAAYMSPEQAQGRRTVDHRTDIYALGVIVYEIATGSIPHDAPTSLAILLKRTTEPPTPPRKLNPKLNERTEQVILQALATEPQHRYDNAANFAKALNASVTKQGVSAIAADNKQRTQDFALSPIESDIKKTDDFTPSPPDREKVNTRAGLSTDSPVPAPHSKDRVLAMLRHPLLLAVVGGCVTAGLILMWNGGAFSSAAVQNRIDTPSLLAAASSTATFTVNPTATPTATPTNTVLPTDTSASPPPPPDATETSVPPTSTATATLPLPTNTPTRPPATPTITPTPTPGIPAGVLTLLKPISVDNPSYGPTEFEWQWSGDLPPELGFEVRVWQEGEPPAGAHDAVLDNRNGRIEKIGPDQYRLNINIRDAAGVRGRSGQYWWTVVLIQISPDYIDLGQSAAPAPLRFEAGGGSGGGGNNSGGGSSGGIS